MTHEQLQYFLLGALSAVTVVLVVIFLDYRLYLRRSRRGARAERRPGKAAATVRHRYDHPPWGRCDCPSEAYHAKYYPAADASRK